jgi:hypothetical protein
MNKRSIPALLAGLFLLTGCATSKFANKADNVHKSVEALPADIRRVAVLPLAAQSGNAELADACETLSLVVYEEFAKTKKFEAVQISPDSLKNLSGAASWTGNEKLPANLLGSLRDSQGCDAVLFSELTVFRAYAPIAIGWRFKLVSTQTQQIIWAADEIFDAAQPSTTVEARHWMRDAIAGFYQSPKDDWTCFHSPALVGRDSVALVLATLPARQ